MILPREQNNGSLSLSPFLVSSEHCGQSYHINFIRAASNRSDKMGTTFHHQHHHHIQPRHALIRKLVTYSLYILVPVALLHLYLFPLPPSADPPVTRRIPPQPLQAPPLPQQQGSKITEQEKSLSHSHSQVQNQSLPQCDFSDGRWVQDARGPRYNSTSCGTIKEGQNCMSHGRPDTGYLHWRWRPNRCALPDFDPASFLEMLEHRHLAFVGDSMARNQLESLLCLLSTASQPELVYRSGEENKFRRWVFREYNVSVSIFWSPFLVKGVEKAEALGINYNKLYLETADERWASQLDRMDMVVFSFGHWYLHSAIYHENDVVLGCHSCPQFNYTEIGFFDVFRKAVRTALAEVRKRHDRSSDKLVVLTTFSPAHFEGEWDKAGACPKTEPYKEEEKEMEYMDALMRKIGVEEVAATAAADSGAVEGLLSFEALDVTKMALLRPDGHPGPYMHPNPFANGVGERVQNDCVHWCLPGPIDAWNEILLEITRRKWRK